MHFEVAKGAATKEFCVSEVAGWGVVTFHLFKRYRKEKAMSSFSQTIVVGNLGNDPEMRYTPDGTPVCSFSLAVNRRWTNQDGTSGEKVTWYKVSTWRKLAESCNQYLTKGRQVLVTGEIGASAWTDEKGEARATLELTARDVRFLGNGEKQHEELAEEIEEPIAL